MMYERNLSPAFFSSVGGPGPSDFNLLANEVWARQRLARSAQPAQKQVLRPPDLPAASLPKESRAGPAAAAGAAAAREASPPPVISGGAAEEVMTADEVKRQPRSDSAHAAPRALRTTGKKMRRAGSDIGCPHISTRNTGGNGAISCRRRPKSNDHRLAAGKYARSGGEPDDARKFNPDVEATMLSAFDGGGKRNRGVSVSAIRSLYRERHEREKEKAMDEVRRWWRLGRSEAGPLARATLAASILLASGAKEGNGREYHRQLPHAETSDTLAESDVCLESPDGGYCRSVADDAKSMMTGSISSARQSRIAVRQCAEDHRDHDESRYYSIFDDLDWQQALKDPSYAEGVVRDIKQVLRGGEPVKLRARENHKQDQPLPGRRTLRDCHLMLKTFYMQCVRYCADPALPPIEQDGEFISMVMEPARRFQVPEFSSETDWEYRSRTRKDASVGQKSCLPRIHSCRGSSW